MVLVSAVRGGAGAVRAGLGVAASVAAHAVWWLDHRLGGSPREVKSRGD